MAQGLTSDLLGLYTAITDLNLGVRVDATTRDNELKENFLAVFYRCGNHGEAYEIKLKPDAQPVLVPRCVPLPLR